MKKWLKWTLIVLLSILLLGTAGIYLKLLSTMDYNSKELVTDQVSADVKVFRDDIGSAIIIAENKHDLFFAQGYEMARDRLWQMQFLMSVGNGELSNLLGEDYIDSDMYLRTLSMQYAANINYEKLDTEYKDILKAFTDGINTYIDEHQGRLPAEFLYANNPRHWTPKDPLAIQGVMAQDLSFSGMYREFLRFDLAIAIGANKTNELWPMDYQPAMDYLTTVDFSNIESDAFQPTIFSKEAEQLNSILGDLGLGGSNNWVVSGNITESGKPILSNDPHLGLSTPSIWWKVQLSAPGFHVEGFSLPGVPSIVTGHNEKVMWGVTNTGTDALDTFYLTINPDNENQYWYNDEWLDFEIEDSPIPLANGTMVDFKIKRSVYGPMMEHEYFYHGHGMNYAMCWTLWDPSERNNLMKAVFDLSFAESVDDIHDTLYYWSNPGQNLVFADINGNVGYQYTGLTPIRANNTFGVVPHNGSAGYVWDGYIPYENHYYVKNPSKGYFGTANQKIDTRDLFYITSDYALGYRGQRINEVLADQNKKFTVSDMEDLQFDTLNLYAKLMKKNIDLISTSSFEDTKKSDVAKILKDWNMRMDREEVGATIFSTFRIFFEEYTVRDELDAVNETLFPRLGGAAKIVKQIVNDTTNVWFDDVSTSVVETSDDIALKAFKAAVDYLVETLGDDTSKWNWGSVHIATFSHVMGEVLGILNNDDISSAGCSWTVNAGGGPFWTEDGIDYTQGHGPSYRMIGIVEPTWSTVEGIMSPGISGHILSKHYDDGVQDWADNIYTPWTYKTTFDRDPDFIFKKQ